MAVARNQIWRQKCTKFSPRPCGQLYRAP